MRILLFCIAALGLFWFAGAPLQAQEVPSSLFDCTLVDRTSTKQSQSSPLKPQKYHKLYALVPLQETIPATDVRLIDKSGLLRGDPVISVKYSAGSTGANALTIVFGASSKPPRILSITETTNKKGLFLGAVAFGVVDSKGVVRIDMKKKPEFGAICGLNSGEAALSKFESLSQ
jgi:hypothetical protein